MITVRRMVSFLLLLLVPEVLLAQSADNLKAFPPADKGMVRYVLQLPTEADESAFQVELMVGKTVKVDEKNRQFFVGKIESEIIKGWGFPRYLVKSIGPMGSTLMAVDHAAPKVERFVTVGTAPYLVRYNSRLPVVVYVPEGAELRYRLWSAGAEIKTPSPESPAADRGLAGAQ